MEFDGKFIYVNCISCRKEFKIPSTLKQWKLLCSENRPHIQDIFPELKPEIRELMISRVCPKCWDMMFGFDDNVTLED